ncbi:hypothetical protein PanWU01x14_349740 [Parasponia andersonii]|uniref:Uncharacterized protein n=1 Tax=Parasponia andersonii TaxID=3476 RepID=A0A2P5AB68_PARAD|nr:hypothetical protein PanWU01x14_349740 [Parasponia andersonii]
MIYACDSYLKLNHMASSFYFVAEKLDTKIDELMVRVLTKEREEYYFHDRVKDFLSEIHDLKENQELLKRGFTGTIMKFCQLLDELDFQDYTYLEVLQDQALKFVPDRGMKTEEEIKLATQEIKRWNGKLAELGKGIIELALRFDRTFPGEKGNFKKEIFDDVNVFLHDTKDHEIIDNGIPLIKVNGTWSWHKLEEVAKSDDQVQWSLTEVMMKMYGFKLDKAKKEVEAIRHLKAALFCASKNHRNLTKNNLINELIRQKKSKLASLMQAIEAIKKSSEVEEELCEAEKLMLEWLYQIEREIFFLVSDLVLIVSIYDQVIVAAFRKDFMSKLQWLKWRKHGRVPVVVYRIIALLEGEAMVVEGNGFILLKEIYVGKFMDQLYKMILLLTSVLNANSNMSSLSMSKKEVIIECVEIVRRCDEAWRAIRMEVDSSMREA